MTRFVVCGETLIDLVRVQNPTDNNASTTWSALSAGGPMNSAVALGRLGVDSHFLGRISRDAFGDQLRRYIGDAGVRLDLATESSQATSIAVVSLDEKGIASYTFHFSDTANFGWQADDLPSLKKGDWLHIASLACVVSPGAEVLLDWVSRLPCGVSYDINVRPTVITDPDSYWERVKPWLRAVGRNGGIVKASDEDLEFLMKAGAKSSDVVDVGQDWVEHYGLGMVVVTLGPGGSVAVLPGGQVVRANGFPTDVVDTVGAGDTFMAGFLDGYVEQKLDVESALRRGAAAASIVCSRRGANPPIAAEVDALLAKSS
jgi:fructokinase